MYRVLVIFDHGYEEAITDDWPHLPSLIDGLAANTAEPVIGYNVTPITTPETPYAPEELRAIRNARQRKYGLASQPPVTAPLGSPPGAAERPSACYSGNDAPPRSKEETP